MQRITEEWVELVIKKQLTGGFSYEGQARAFHDIYKLRANGM